MRPQSLAEVARLVVHGQSFDFCLANFLDEFYAHPAQSRLDEEPEPMRLTQGEFGQLRDAYLAATAAELARMHGFPCPAWTDNDHRSLRKPWFASSLSSLRAVLIHESPVGFRARNLFVSANALSRV